MELKNEYLIFIEKNGSGFYELCKTIKQFNQFIEFNESIKIKESKIFFNSQSYAYSVKSGKVDGKNERYFYVTLIFKEDEDGLKNYKLLNRELKNIFSKKDVIIEILRDDISFYYSKKSYSLIHYTENLMRKFITYFMITKVGKNWVEQYSPTKVENALDKSKRKNSNVLQNLDFIHLGDFLFNSYNKSKFDDLINRIKKLKNNESISKNEFDDFIPQSNWNKFFKNEINFEEESLKKKWNSLYELRNKIAHSSDFNEEDYDRVKKLSYEVKEKLEEAFDKISTIQINEEEKEKLSEDIVRNANEYIGSFIEQWVEIEKTLRLIKNGNSEKYQSPHTLLKKIEPNLQNSIREIMNIRNRLVHGDLPLDSQPLPISYLETIKNELISEIPIE